MPVGSLLSLISTFICFSLSFLVEHVVDEVHRLQFLLVNDFCIHLRHLDTAVTEYLAHRVEVGTEREKHGGVGMAAAVIGDRLLYPCLLHPLPEYHFHCRRGDLQLVVNDDYTFHYYIISRRQFIDLLYESHQWYKYSWNREKDIKDSSPACLSTKWLSGVGEHETDKHEKFINPLQGVSTENSWDNIWKD